MGATGKRIPNLDTAGANTVIAGAASLGKQKADIVIPAGATDAEVYINRALAALTNGGRVVLLDGTYTISASIILANPSLELLGIGTGTQIVAVNNAAAFSLISIQAADGYVIDLAIDGNRANQGAINQDGITMTGDRGLARKVHVQNCMRDGIRITGGNDNIIENGRSTGHGGIGIVSLSGRTIIRDTSVNNVDGKGIRSESDTTFLNCDVSGSGNDGMGLYWGINKVMAGHFYNNGRHGIDMANVADSTITNATIDSNTEHGIRCQNSGEVRIVGCSIRDNGTHGINASSQSRTLISTNNLTANGRAGLGLGPLTSASITSNAIALNQEDGINMYEVSRSNVMANTVEQNSQSAHNTYDGILIRSDSNRNSLQVNKVSMGTASPQQRYGVRVRDANCDGNIVANNDLLNSGATGPILNNGTGTVTSLPNNRT